MGRLCCLLGSLLVLSVGGESFFALRYLVFCEPAGEGGMEG
jgi:hypothetical protein